LRFAIWWQRLRGIRSAGLSLYKRGMTQANRHDETSAMESYTKAIEMPDMPDDVRAMSLYNRALLHAVRKDYALARADLNAIFAIPRVPHQIVSAAQQKLERMQLREAAETS
jgi:hypothetical protein